MNFHNDKVVIEYIRYAQGMSEFENFEYPQIKAYIP